MAPPLSERLFAIVSELVRRNVSLVDARREFERQYLVASLKRTHGNQCKAARNLQVHRNTIRFKVSDLGIGPRDLNLAKRSRRKMRTPAPER